MRKLMFLILTVLLLQVSFASDGRGFKDENPPPLIENQVVTVSDSLQVITLDNLQTDFSVAEIKICKQAKIKTVTLTGNIQLNKFIKRVNTIDLFKRNVYKQKLSGYYKIYNYRTRFAKNVINSTSGGPSRICGSKTNFS